MNLENIIGKAGESSPADETATISYYDLSLSTEGVRFLKSVNISQFPGEHQTMEVEALLDGGLDEKAIHGIGGHVFLTCKKGSGQLTLFHGFICRISICKDGEGSLLHLEAQDSTGRMDIVRRSRAFQNPRMTNHQLIREVLAAYPGSDCQIHIPEEPLGDMVLQYEETDWEFLKRFLSRYRQQLYPDAGYRAIRLHAGLPSKESHRNWDHLPYEIVHDFAYYDEMRQNGVSQVFPSHCVEYRVENGDLEDLGSQITYKGSPWLTAGVVRRLSRGLLVSRYRLRRKEGLLAAPSFNHKIVGLSVGAVVSDVRRDRIQADLELDDKKRGADKFWFPFFTTAASPDGSGWHFMPEKGENVRLYFPTENEKDAYLVVCAKSHAPVGKSESDPMGDPDVRNIYTDQKNRLRFTNKGIDLSAGDGVGGLTVQKDGNVCFRAGGNFTVLAGKKFRLEAKKTLKLKSQTSVEIAGNSGSDVKLSSGEIKLHGMEIHEN